MDVSIVIVSFNTCDMTMEAIRSVFRETKTYSFEIIVYDNNSIDGSAEAIRNEFGNRVKLIRSDENIGFAPANNRAVEYASGKWILLLNPDTVVLDRAIDRIIEFASNNPNHKIYGGRTVFADGSVNDDFAWGMPTPLSMFFRGIGLSSVFKGSRYFNREMIPGWDRVSSRKVDVVSGCFFLISSDDWAALRGFDEDFPMYGEEVDMCRRASLDLGASPFVFADAVIIHHKGASDTVREHQTVRQFAAKAIFFKKHWGFFLSNFAVVSIDLWALNKFARSVIRRDRTESVVWLRILRRIGEWHAPHRYDLLRSTRIVTAASVT